MKSRPRQRGFTRISGRLRLANPFCARRSLAIEAAQHTAPRRFFTTDSETRTPVYLPSSPIPRASRGRRRPALFAGVRTPHATCTCCPPLFAGNRPGRIPKLRTRVRFPSPAPPSSLVRAFVEDQRDPPTDALGMLGIGPARELADRGRQADSEGDRPGPTSGQARCRSASAARRPTFAYPCTSAAV